MTYRVYNAFSTKTTPQNEKISGSKQVKNNAGGYVYKLDEWAMLDRFLVLGSESGTYYTSERSLTKDNANNVLECINADGIRVIVERADMLGAGAQGGQGVESTSAADVQKALALEARELEEAEQMSLSLLDPLLAEMGVNEFRPVSTEAETHVVFRHGSEPPSFRATCSRRIGPWPPNAGDPLSGMRGQARRASGVRWYQCRLSGR